MGIRAVIDRFMSASQQVYKTRGWNDDDIDLATLVLRIGGPSLLHVFAEQNKLPSSSFIYKVSNIINNC